MLMDTMCDMHVSSPGIYDIVVVSISTRLSPVLILPILLPARSTTVFSFVQLRSLADGRVPYGCQKAFRVERGEVFQQM